MANNWVMAKWNGYYRFKKLWQTFSVLYSCWNISVILLLNKGEMYQKEIITKSYALA